MHELCTADIKNRVIPSWFGGDMDSLLWHHFWFSREMGMLQAAGPGIPIDVGAISSEEYPHLKILSELNRNPLSFIFEPDQVATVVRDWYDSTMFIPRTSRSTIEVSRIRAEAKYAIDHLSLFDDPRVNYLKPAVQLVHEMFSRELGQRCSQFIHLLKVKAEPREFRSYLESFVDSEDPWELDERDIIVRYSLTGETAHMPSNRSRGQNEREFSQTPVRSILRFLKEYPKIAPKPNSFLVDIGSGSGISSAVFFLLTGCRVRGIEIDPNLHKMAQRISRRLPIEFLNLDAENTEFEDCTHVYFASSINLGGQRKMWSNIARAGNPTVMMYWDNNVLFREGHVSVNRIYPYTLKEIFQTKAGRNKLFRDAIVSA